MSPPVSALFEVRAIENAGRGVIAIQNVSASIVMLDSEAPAAHVIFRQYRKEVCARCFEYDRGRTLSVRSGDTGKVFCSTTCQEGWVEQQGQLGLEAWRLLHAFVQSRMKALIDIYSVAPISPRPTRNEIAVSWQKVNVKAKRDGVNHVKDDVPRRKVKGNNHKAKVDPDILAYLLSGILFHYHHPDAWQEEVISLAMDATPYNSAEDLEAHCNSFLQLHAILPTALQTSCSTAVCRVLAEAGSHNSFGIRAGSEDGEEYMGYSLYPSASYFNHSCDPNISKRRVGSSWVFQAAKHIAQGEECCITYLGGDEKDLTVVERRERLDKVWGFKCMCERCRREAGE